MKERLLQILALALAVVTMLCACGSNADTKKTKSKKKSKDTNASSSQQYEEDGENSEEGDADDDYGDGGFDISDYYSSNNSVSSASSSTDQTLKPLSTNQWKQDKFYLSTCWPSSYNVSTELRYRAIDYCIEAGLNLIQIGACDSSEITTQVKYCQQKGIACIVDTKFSSSGTGSVSKFNESNIHSELERFQQYSNIIGYNVWDEVASIKLNDCKEMVSAIKKYDPVKLAYTCLFPSYGVHGMNVSTGGGWDSEKLYTSGGVKRADVTNATYYKYVDNYIKTVDPQVLAFDYYPFILDSGLKIIYRDWYKDMGLFRKKSLQYNKPFWYYIGSVDSGLAEVGNITREQISVQSYVALAYGAKYISYYTTGGYFYDSDEYEKTDRFEEGKKINQKVMALGQFLFDKTSTKIYHTSLDDQEYYNDIYFLDDLSKSELIASAPSKLIVGMFSDGKTNKEYMLLVNKNLQGNCKKTVKLKAKKNVSYYNTNTGKIEASVYTDEINTSIVAGGADLYIIN